MVGAEEAIEILEHATEERIVNIQLIPAGFIRGYLLNHIDLKRPYRVIVDPRWQSMRVWMTSTVKVRCRAISKAVQRTRCSINLGLVGIDPNGAVSFRYNDDANLTSSQLALVLNEMIASVERFEMAVIFYTMLDSYIPRGHVREIMRSKFPKWKTKPAKLYRGTL